MEKLPLSKISEEAFWEIDLAPFPDLPLHPTLKEEGSGAQSSASGVSKWVGSWSSIPYTMETGGAPAVLLDSGGGASRELIFHSLLEEADGTQEIPEGEC